MKKNKKILITGGSGFLGGHVAEKLIKEGYYCYILDIKRPTFLKSYNNKFTFIQGNISNRKKLLNIVKKVDIVYHFAAEADIGFSSSKVLDTIKLNLFSTVELLNICVLNKIERFIFASSIYVFSEQGGFYKTTKQSCELLIENFNEEFGLKYSILRYGSLYGIRANKFNWIYKVIDKISRNEEIIRESNGYEKRRYINVEDAARASLEILKKRYENKHILLTGNEEMTIRSLLKKIVNMSGKKIRIKYLNKKNLKNHYHTSPYTFKPRVGKKMLIKKQKKFDTGLIEIFKEFRQ